MSKGDFYPSNQERKIWDLQLVSLQNDKPKKMETTPKVHGEPSSHKPVQYRVYAGDSA